MTGLTLTATVQADILAIAQSRSHKRNHCIVRQCVAAALHENGMTYPEMADLLCRHRTTFYNTILVAHDNDMRDEAYRAIYDALKEKVAAELL